VTDPSVAPIVAAVQMQSTAGKVDANLSRICELLDDAVAAGVDVAVLPETCLQGYGYGSAEEVRRDAASIGSPLLGRLRDEVARRGLHAVVGFIEEDGGRVFNSSALIDGDGALLAVYRKLHLPGIGVDRFVENGERTPPVVDTPVGRLSLLICADMIFPEAARVAALDGADVLAISACVPSPITIYGDALIAVRAYENCMYVVFSDMVGPDGAWRYVGRSLVANPSGAVLGAADTVEQAVVAAPVEVVQARSKVRVRQPSGGIPHAYEVDFFGQRQPHLYGAITRTRGGEADTAWGDLPGTTAAQAGLVERPEGGA